MKKILSLAVAALAIILTLGSCNNAKQVVYWQNIDSTDISKPMLWDAKIMPKDLLSIVVRTVTSEVAQPFNFYQTNGNGSSNMMGNTNNQNQQGYLVDNDGNIQFPVIGTIHVAGLTTEECEKLIKSKVEPYLAKTENPVVQVRMSSYHITVMGEVASPGVKSVPQEKMNIVEALAESGDMTLYGRRNNILLIRENAKGQKEVHRLNMNDAKIFTSPYYYLQQNDIVYVEPNKMRTNTASFNPSISYIVGIVSFATSMASLIVNILK
ncbi:MAG: polysaccharide biosynthesis/export family protein [Prevotellaceae bacterium]|nr:polysaccharide biosynthesis/export family protein [Prevotellaceae bacterium]